MQRGAARCAAARTPGPLLELAPALSHCSLTQTSCRRRANMRASRWVAGCPRRTRRWPPTRPSPCSTRGASGRRHPTSHREVTPRRRCPPVCLPRTARAVTCAVPPLSAPDSHRLDSTRLDFPPSLRPSSLRFLIAPLTLTLTLHSSHFTLTSHPHPHRLAERDSSASSSRLNPSPPALADKVADASAPMAVCV